MPIAAVIWARCVCDFLNQNYIEEGIAFTAPLLEPTAAMMKTRSSSCKRKRDDFLNPPAEPSSEKSREENKQRAAGQEKVRQSSSRSKQRPE